MVHSVCGAELTNRVARVWDRCGLESSRSIMKIAHRLRVNLAVSPFTTELPWSHDWFNVNRFYNDGIVQTDTGAGNCGEYNGKKKRSYGAETCIL